MGDYLTSREFVEYRGLIVFHFDKCGGGVRLREDYCEADRTIELK